MGPLKLTAAQEKELLRLQRFYHSEVKRCKEAKAYLAGCVMAGAELETSLTLMVNIYQDEAEATQNAPRQKGTIKPLLKWNFSELIQVAKAANWLPSALHYGVDDWDHKRAEAGDYAEVVREMRNLAHPARYLEDHYRKRVTNKHLEWILDSINVANGWLLARIEKSLIEAMKAEGWTERRKNTALNRRKGESQFKT